jgi:hypothetical protein
LAIGLVDVLNAVDFDPTSSWKASYETKLADYEQLKVIGVSIFLKF